MRIDIQCHRSLLRQKRWVSVQNNILFPYMYVVLEEKERIVVASCLQKEGRKLLLLSSEKYWWDILTSSYLVVSLWVIPSLKNT